jgi:hypothetical protein
MSSRLYPYAPGSGKVAFEGFFAVRCHPDASLEHSDKIILPHAAFSEITRLRLPLPFVFQVHNDRAISAAAVPSRHGPRRAVRGSGAAGA